MTVLAFDVGVRHHAHVVRRDRVCSLGGVEFASAYFGPWWAFVGLNCAVREF